MEQGVSRVFGADGHRPVVIIYVRFSLISAGAGGAWKGQRLAGGVDEHAQRILDPDRLKTRSDIFFGYSVPLIKQAIEENPDLDINVIIHSSTLLPEAIQESLKSLAETGPFHPTFFDPEDDCDFRVDATRFLSEKMSGKTGKVLVPAMRLDDDDLLSPRYFNILKRYLSDQFVGFTVHSPRGYEALYVDGGFSAFSLLDAPKTGIGLCHISLWNATKGRFASKNILPPGRHSDTDALAPVILDGSNHVILRTKHVFNDARATRDGYSFNTAEDLDRRFFRDKVEPGDEKLTQNFPTLRPAGFAAELAVREEIAQAQDE